MKNTFTHTQIMKTVRRTAMLSLLAALLFLLMPGISMAQTLMFAGGSGGFESSVKLYINGVEQTRVDQGWHNILGAHSSGNPNYIAAYQPTYRNYFVFTRTGSGSITSASLQLNSVGVNGSITFSVTALTGYTPAQLDASRSDNDATGMAIYAATLSGTALGSLNSPSANTVYTIPLSNLWALENMGSTITLGGRVEDGSSYTAPVLTTNAASSVTTTGGTMNASITPNSNSGNCYFQYGTSSGSYPSSTTTQSYSSGTSTFTQALTGLTAGTTYYYRAYATVSGHSDVYGSEQSFTTPPPNLTSISAGASTICNGGSTLLTANGTITGGTVYWYTSSCGGTSAGSGNTLTVYPTTTTTYYAKNYKGGQYSPGCASTTITVNNPATLPSSASCTGTTANTASLSWGSSTGTGTVYYYWVVGTSSSVTYPSGTSGWSGTTTDPTKTATATNLSPSTTYYLRVMAGTSAPCTTSAYQTSTSFTTVPAAPVAADATNLKANSFTANWASSTGATKYFLDIATNSGFGSGTFVTGYENRDMGTALTASLSGLNRETNYYYRVRAQNGGGTSVSSNTITVLTLPLNNFLIEKVGGGNIDTQTSGTAFNIKITARDATNTTVTDFTGTTVLTTNSTITAGTPTGSFVTGVLSSQSVTLTLAGTLKTITATSGGVSSTSTTFTVLPGAINYWELTVDGPVTAGTPFTVTARVYDVFNNLKTNYDGPNTVEWVTTASTSLSGMARLIPANGPQTFDHGVAAGITGFTFYNSMETPTITISDGATSVAFTTSPITIMNAGIDNFKVEAGQYQQSGVDFPITVTARDVYFNTQINPHYTGSIRFKSSNDALVHYPADYTYLTGDNGVKVFTGSLATTIHETGTYWIRVAEVADLSKNGMQEGIVVSPGPFDPAQSTFTVDFTNRVAGEHVLATMIPRDASGNKLCATKTPISVKLHGLATDGLENAIVINALVDAGTPVTATGVYTADVVVTKASLTYNDLCAYYGGTAFTPECYTIVVTPAPVDLAHTTITADKTTMTVDQTSVVTVQLYDQYDNKRDADDGTVELTTIATPTLGTLKTTGTNHQTLNAVYSGGTTGAYTATFLMDAIGLGTATISGKLDAAAITDNAQIVITHGAATNLAIHTQPPTTKVAGVTLNSPVIYIQDQFNNLVTTGLDAERTIAVDKTGGSGPGTLFNTLTAVATGGVATFNDLYIRIIGDYWLDFTNSGVTHVVSDKVTITHDVASQLMVYEWPTTGVAGQVFSPSPVIMLLDQYTNPVTTGATAAGTVTVAKNSGPGTIDGTLTATASAGVATFSNLSTTTSGTYTLDFTKLGLTHVVSNNIVIDPASPTVYFTLSTPADIVAGTRATYTVTRRDLYGNPTVTGTQTVDLSSTSTGLNKKFYDAASGGGETTSITIPDGSSTYTFSYYDELAGDFTITASTTTLPAILSADDALTVISDAATHLAVTGSATQTAGETKTVNVKAYDQFNNQASGYTGSHNITFSGANTSPAPVTHPTVNTTDFGTATAMTFTAGAASGSMILYNVETAVVTVVDEGSRTSLAHELSVVVSHATASKLAINTQPEASVVAGVNFNPQPKIHILDPYGNIVTSGTDATGEITVALAVTSTGTGSLHGTLTATAVGGVATFSGLHINIIGDYYLEFSYGAFTHVTSNKVTIRHDVATHLAISTPITATTDVAGVNLAPQPVIHVLDQFENLVTTGDDASAVITVSKAGSSTGLGSLIGTATATASNGVATFSGLKFEIIGDYYLNFNYLTFATVTSPKITITHAPASQLALITPTTETSDVAGVDLDPQPVIHVLDQFGNLVTTGGAASAVITVSKAGSSTGLGSLIGTATATAGSGIATFSGLKFNIIGDYYLNFNYSTFVTVTSPKITITHAPATHLAISTPTTATTDVAGVNLAPQPVIHVLDQFDNLVTTGTDASAVITVTKAGTSTGLGSLIGTATATASNGVATFSGLKFNIIGDYYLAFDYSTFATVTSPKITITHAPATHLAIFTPTTETTDVAGVNLAPQPVIHVLDAFDNLVSTGTDASAIITVTKAGTSTGAGLLIGTATATASGGVASFSGLKFNVIGDYYLNFDYSTFATVTSPKITITHAPATHLAIVTQPESSVVAGVNFAPQPVIHVLDQFDNLVSTGTDASAVIPVILGSGTTGTGSLLGTASATAAGGVATFSGLHINIIGDYYLEFSYGAFAHVTSTKVTIIHDVATHLAISTQPQSSVIAGVNFAPQPVVRVLDQFDNLVTTGTDATAVIPVVLGSGTTGSGSLLGTASATAVAGVATFSGLHINIIGDYYLEFSYSTFTHVTSTKVTITHAAATHLAIYTQPESSVIAGVNFAPQPVINVLDQFNNLVSTGADAGATIPVILGSGTTGTGSLLGTASATAVGGVASFSGLHINIIGDYYLEFSYGGFAHVTSDKVTITHAPATHLAITTQPQSIVTAGQNFAPQPVLNILDQFDNLVTTGVDATGTVTVSKAGSSTGAGPLLGTLGVAAVGGVVSFSGLHINIWGTYYLDFDYPTFTKVTSTSITIMPDVTYRLSLTSPADITAGTRAAYTVSRYDQFDNPRLVGAETISLASSSDGANKAFYPTGSSTSPMTTVTIASGTSSSNFWYYDEKTSWFGTTGQNLFDASWTITASLSGVNSGTDQIKVNPTVLGNAPNSFRITTPGVSTYYYGDWQTIKVDALDIYGNIKTNYIGAVSFSNTDLGASNPPTSTYVATDYGSRTFTSSVFFSAVSTGPSHWWLSAISQANPAKFGGKTFIVLARPITITANDRNKIYGDALTLGTSEFSVTGTFIPVLSSGQSVTSVTLTSSGAVNTANYGDYSVTPSGATGTGGFLASNYNISYVDGNLAVAKKDLTVTGVTDSKAYDGGVSSTGSPTVGALASKDVINVAPYQTYDDKNVGTTHVLTPAGLTIKDATTLVNMTGNYNITYDGSPATGVITKKHVDVTAATDTKTYDGNTTSDGVPSVGALASGDVVNTVPTQTYDDKMAGTGKIMTPAGLTIKTTVGGADVTANYDIHYNTNSSGVINQFHVDVTAATDTKIYDANTSSDGVPAVGSLVSGDVVNAAPTQTYDTKMVGTGKTMTATGLTVKDGLNADMTANYDIHYNTNNTGIINQLHVDVTADTDTKTYDGYTTSDGVPSVGTLASGDIVNAAPIQTYNSIMVGTGKTMTPAGLTVKATSGGADMTANYDIHYVTNLTGVIEQLHVDVTAATDTKIYDANTSSDGVPTVGTLAVTDAVNVAPIQTYDTKLVGTGKTMTASSLTIKTAAGGADMTGNYDIHYITDVTGEITKLHVDVTAVTDTKIYDGTTSSDEPPVVGTLAVGDVVNVAPVQTFDTKMVGTGKTLTPAGLTIKASSGGADVTANYEIHYVTNITGVINLLHVDVTAATDTKTYDANTSSDGIPAVGTLASGDAVNNAPTQTYDTKMVGTGKVMTATGLTVKDGLNADMTANYFIHYLTNSTGVINQLHVDVTAATDTKTYDGNATSDGIPTVGTLASGDVVNGAPTQTYDNKTAGTGKTMTPAGLTVKASSDDADMTANYDIHYVTDVTGVINQLHVDVTAATDTKIYDGNTTSDGVPAVGTLASGDVVNVAPIQTYDTKMAGTSKVMTPAGLTIKDGSSGNMTANYDIHYITDGTGVISQKHIDVTAATDNKTYDGNTSSDGVPTVAVLSLVSGDVVNNSPTQTYDTKMVGTSKVMTPAGLTIKDALDANMTANYDIHYITDGTGVITQKDIDVTAATDTKTYDGNTSSDGVPTVAVASLASGDVVNNSPTQTYDNKNVGTSKVMTPAGLTVKDAFNADMTANYNINYITDGTGVINRKPITGNFTADNKVYDGNADATILTRTLNNVETIDIGFVSLVGGTATFSDKNVGNGKTVTSTGMSLSGAQAGNYTLTSVGTTTADITVRTLNLSNFAADSKDYDGSTVATGLGFNDDRVSGDNLAFTRDAAFLTASVGNGKTVHYSNIVISGGADKDNYVLASTTGNATANIYARALAIDADDQQKPFGIVLTGGTGFTSFTSSGLQNGETIGSVTIAYGTGAAANAPIATYTNQVTASAATGGTFTASNYSITYNSADIIVVPATVISGYIRYNNNASTPMGNVTVTLKSGSTTVASVVSSVVAAGPLNKIGYYEFNNVPAGTYDVVMTKSGSIYGSINYSDAAQANQWYNSEFDGLWTAIQKTRFFAGDVTGDYTIQPNDAFLIQSCFLNDWTTWTGHSPRPDWTFWKDEITQLNSNNVGELYPQITVVPFTDLSQSFYALATGDFNRGFVPGSSKSASDNVRLDYGQTIKADANGMGELTVYTESAMQLGAMSLVFNYPSDKLEVLDVVMNGNSVAPLDFNVIGDELRIGWNSQSPLNLKAAQKLFTVRVRLLGTLTENETVRFSLAANPLNELADGSFLTIGNAGLNMDVLGSSTLGVTPIVNGGNLSLVNYPNPFGATTTFSYTLPSAGEVTIEIRNMLGSVVKTLVNGEKQTAGDHKLKLDAISLENGMYTATLKLNTGDQTMTRTIKVIRNH